ncbi:MAG: sigma-70 family RNA polymerase sigma factor [Dehalococcoidia bacterium]
MATRRKMEANPCSVDFPEIIVQEGAKASAGSQACAGPEHGWQGHVELDAVTDPRDSPVVDVLTRRSGWDTVAFAEFVTEFEPRIAAVLSRMLDDPRDAAQATQDTFVQAWRNLDGFRGDAAVFTWLYRIATNTALMRLRRRRHHTVNIDELRDTAEPNGTDLAGEVVSRLQVIDAVRTALALLPPDQRVVVALRDIEGFSNDEVADVLDVAVSTVKTRLHRGRARLRSRLHPARR